MAFSNNLYSFLRDNEATIRLRLKQKLSELDYHGKYCLSIGFEETLLLQGTEYPGIILMLSGHLEDDMETMYDALHGIFAPHALILCMEYLDLEDLDPRENLGPATESANQPQDESQAQPSNVAQVDQGLLGSSSVSNDYAMEVQADPRPEYKFSWEPNLTVTTGPENAEDHRTFGIGFGITIEFNANESRKERPKDAPANTILVNPWFSLNFTELRAWSDKNEQFLVSALRVLIEATPPLETKCKIISPEWKKSISNSLPKITPDVSIIDQWSINTFEYTKTIYRRGQEDRDVQVVEVDYMDRDLTRVPSSIIGQVKVDEKDLPRVVLSSPATSGRSLRVCVNALWKSDMAPRQNPLILYNFLHKTSFEIDLEGLIREQSFTEELRVNQPTSTHYTVRQVIEGETDEVQGKKCLSDLAHL